MALLSGLTYSEGLGGVFSLSGFLFPNLDEKTFQKLLPIYISHGDEDFMVPWDLANQSYKVLTGRENISLNLVKGLDHSIEQV